MEWIIMITGHHDLPGNFYTGICDQCGNFEYGPQMSTLPDDIADELSDELIDECFAQMAEAHVCGELNLGTLADASFDSAMRAMGFPEEVIG
ncbi:MAG: hypothetical protein WCP26_15830 [Actinomycetes bacterium]